MMKKFSITDLAEIIKAREPRVTSDERCFFTGVSIDSRTTKAGDCFFAIAGDNFDGHHYVADALAKGALWAVVEKDKSIEASLKPRILKVGDTIKALGDFAGEYRRQEGFKVVAITGSIGKTTARQIAYHVLSQHFRVSQAPKNFNNNIGVPLTLLAAAPQDQIVITELASNRPGEIAYLTGIAEPDIAVVTNACLAHLAGLANLETIIQEKLSIAKGLRPNGALIINATLANQTTDSRAVTFGMSGPCDIKAENICFKGTNSTFDIGRVKVALPLAGLGNVENALAAWAVCSKFGVNIDDFARAVKSLTAVPMRAEVLQIGKLTVLNDCYNANPASMKNALDILVNLGSDKKGRLVFICGDMAELGSQAGQLHTELGSYIAKAKVQLLLTVGKFVEITAQTAKAAAEYDLKTESFQDNRSVCNNLGKFIKDSDIILVKGSRVTKLEIVVDKLKELFAERFSVQPEVTYRMRVEK